MKRPVDDADVADVAVEDLVDRAAVLVAACAGVVSAG
jgi:hypothetical protein